MIQDQKISEARAQETPPPYKLSHLVFEGLTLFVFVLCLGLFLLRLLEMSFPQSWLSIIVACVLGLIAADVVSGLVHWAADTWGNFTTPFFGPWLIRSFREHHADPLSIVRHGFIETNGANSAGGVVLILPAHFFLSTYPLLSLFLLTFAIGISITNQVHKWSHAPSRGPVLNFLQRRGLLLSPDHHAKHHSGEFNQHYCITLGVMNYPLEKISFFRRLEKKITDWTGAVPRSR